MYNFQIPIQLLTHSMANYFFYIAITLSFITLILWIIIGYTNVEIVYPQFNVSAISMNRLYCIIIDTWAFNLPIPENFPSLFDVLV